MKTYQSAIQKGLPKKTKSFCPVCNKPLEASIYEKDGEVMISKRCPEHGYFEDVYWSDVGMYLWAEKFAYDGKIDKTHHKIEEGCPYDCGLCKEHRSSTILANIDVTNRCNLNCDFCFANANARGYVYEPTFEQVVEMLTALREEKPVPCTAVQFAGGEPTLKEDIFDMIRTAKEMGFSQVQLATNGIKMKDPNFVKRLRDAGLSTVYLHFDGLTKDVEPYIDVRKEVIENCRKVDQGVVLVPTIIKGFNDHQIGDMIKFAARNIDVIRGVNFQPISFSGRATHAERKEKRYTIPDLAKDIEEQMGGQILKKDFYPVPCVVPLSKLVEVYKGKPQIEFSAHPHCGMATYVFVNDGDPDDLIPINRFVNVDKFFETIEGITDDLKKGGILNKGRAVKKGLEILYRYIDNEKKPKSLRFRKLLEKVLLNQDYKSLGDFHETALFVGSMHFQDIYNIDIERVKRCVIHYATPDPERRIIPFCAYNTIYRDKIERKYAVPIDEWRKEHIGNEGV